MTIVLTNPFTGKPFEKAPDGTDMKGLEFNTKEEALAFADAHWPSPPVEMVEVPEASK